MVRATDPRWLGYTLEEERRYRAYALSPKFSRIVLVIVGVPLRVAGKSGAMRSPLRSCPQRVYYS